MQSGRSRSLRAAQRLALIGVLALAAAACNFDPGLPAREDSAGAWRELEPGLELGTFRISAEAEPGLHVLRIDPERFTLRLLSASALPDRRALTAQQWTRTHALRAAINSSMYQQDHLTSVSLMRTQGHVNNPRVSRDMTILAFDPREPSLPAIKLLDLECDDLEEWKPRYATLVQSIRMISCDGKNVWSPQGRSYSTAAIGLDTAGRPLFIHLREPLTPHDLIERLQALPLEIDRLMYAEGGPEAQLFIAAGGESFEFVGGFHTPTEHGYAEDQAWPVPNVIGVVPRQ
jgi:hypothetical protein